MANIHYIWWGDPQTREHRSAALDTPNAVFAGINGTHQVQYWTWSRPFNAPLAAGMTHTPIDIDTVDNAAALLIQNDPRVWYGIGILLRDVLRALTDYGAYSAVKDLLSLVVLYKEGGYYFDTSTVVPPGSVRDFLDNRLIEPEGPRVVLRPSDGGPSRPTFSLNVAQRTGEATLSPGAGSRGDVKSVHAIDVWAMYAPARHESVATMIHAYLQRCSNLGLNRHPSGARAVGYGVHDIMTNANRSTRNQIIGNLIICSVQEGLYRWAEKTGQTSADYGWATTDQAGRTPAGCDVYCEELSLGKRHAGIWRG